MDMQSLTVGRPTTPQKQPVKVFEGVNDSKYYLIDTLPKWKELFNKLMKQKIVACDTETTGLSYMSCQIVGLSFAFTVGEGYYVPVRHTFLEKDIPASTVKKPVWHELRSLEKQLDIDTIKDDLLTFFGNPDIATVWHNYKFDGHFLRNEGIKIGGVVHDTVLMHSILDENSSSKLKVLAAEFISPEADRWETLITDYRLKFARRHKMKKDNIHYGLIPLDLMTPYAASDTDYTLFFYHHFIEQIINEPNLRKLYVTIEIPLMHVLLDMEHLGAVIDRPYLEEVGPIMLSELEELQEKIYTKLGQRINVESNVQIIPLLTKMGIRFSKKTETGRWSLDKSILEALASKYDVCADIKNLKEHRKLHSTYITGILEKSVSDSKVHSSYNQNVSTGRMCIAKGSLVQAPCDRSIYPDGIPIELIKEGDNVYTYDTLGNLLIRKVKWAGSRGIRKVIKLNWQGSGHKKKGELILTPDHPVLTTDGRWIEAQNLVCGSRVMSLSSGIKQDYPYLYARYNSEIREHRFIYEHLYGELPPVVHHINHNKLDNTPSNLEKSSFSEHSVHHASFWTEEERRSKGRILQDPIVRKRAAESHLKGENHPLWKHISKKTLIKWAVKYRGQIRKIMEAANLDYNILQRKYKLYNIDLKCIKAQYGIDGKRLTKERVKKALQLKQPDSYHSLGIGFYKFKELCEKYNLCLNHEILFIENAGEIEVFDIEVEDTHAFIANEICVHNSSSKINLQNIPRNNKVIRKAFIVPSKIQCENPLCNFSDFISHVPSVCPKCTGNIINDSSYFMLLIDFSQIEVRLTAHASEDPILLDVYNNTKEDVHLRTCCEMFDYKYKEAEQILLDSTHLKHYDLKSMRSMAKMINFLIIYGGGASSLATKISTPQRPYTEIECNEFIHKYLDKYQGVRDWVRKTKIEALRNHKVQNEYGRYRRFPGLADADRLVGTKNEWKIKQAYRQAVNYVIQGEAADLFKTSMIRANKVLQGTKSKLVMPIHDEIIFYYHREDMHLLSEVVRTMQDFNYKVPIIVDLSYTTTSWADKKELKLNS
jgi:DNA polymerase I-like protein with 3'-5' exonuclease and polymerase domains